MDGARFAPLDPDNLRMLEGWAMLSRSMGYVYRPSTLDGLCEVLSIARHAGRSIAPRGSGFSYGDAALNAENVILDTTRMNRVLEWDPLRGRIKVEPGVTIGQLWRYAIEDGWWPTVVPGTMHPTIGGCAAMNVHGKNSWHAGTTGDAIDEFTLLLPSGESRRCSRERNPDLFRAAIGGLGMLGVFIDISLNLTRIQSGLLRLERTAASSLDKVFDRFENQSHSSDYLVGWVDAFAEGPDLGRGLIESATYVEDDVGRATTLRAAYQDLPDTVLGVVPRSRLWIAMRAVASDRGMRALNIVRYASGSIQSGRVVKVPHAHFHFYLDYVPNFKRAFQPKGLVQYQIFLPHVAAKEVFRTVLRSSQDQALVPYLAVLKLHKEDNFLLRYNVDGYSLALDYRATPSNHARLRRFLDRLTEDVVLPAGGRFYPAKDSLLHAKHAHTMFGEAKTRRFLEIKREVDPEGLLQSELYRRLFMTGGDPEPGYDRRANLS